MRGFIHWLASRSLAADICSARLRRPVGPGYGGQPEGVLTSGGGRVGGGPASLQRSMLVSWRGTSLSSGVRGGWLRFQLETPPSKPPDRAVAAPCGVRRYPNDGGRIAFPRCRCDRHKKSRWSNAGCRQTRSWLNSALRLAKLAQGIRRVLSEWPAMSKRAERTRQRPFDSPGSLRAFDVFSPSGENTSNGGERGIRTLGTGCYQYDGLANRCFRPLSHLSVQGGGKVGDGGGLVKREFGMRRGRGEGGGEGNIQYSIFNVQEEREQRTGDRGPRLGGSRSSNKQRPTTNDQQPTTNSGVSLRR